MKHVLITLVMCAMTCTATSAQEATDTTVREVPAIVGKQVRIWPTESIAPIDGRVASINRSVDTDDVYCGISGCVRSFGSNWVDLDRVEVGRLDTTERTIRLVLVASVIGLVLGPGITACESDAGCLGLMAGLGTGLGVGGYYVTRQSWLGIPIPR